MNQNPQPDSNRELASAPVGKLLWKLAVPMVLAQIVNMLYNVVDRIYIGHIPVTGDLALTGLGLCFPVIALTTAFFMLVAQGGAPLAAIEMGRGDSETAERYLGTCCTGLVAVAILLTAAFELWGEQLLWLFGASEKTIVYALPYMRVYAGGSLFVMLAMGLNLFITTQGFAKYSMLSIVIGAVTNIVLDPVMIFLFHWGVYGAAIATILSQAVSAVFVVSFLLGKRTKLRLRRAYLKPDFRLLGKAMALGLAPFIMQATEAALNIAFNSSLQRYGGDIAVGAMTIASTIMMMIVLPANGIGQGAQPIISYNYGAGNAARVREAVRKMFVAAFVYMAVLWGLVELFPGAFIRIFNSKPELVGTATWALRLYMAAMGLFGLQMAAQQTFMATGKAKSSLFVALLRKVILLIPLIYILPQFFEDKVFAVFLAEPIADGISVTVCTVFFLTSFRKDMQRLEAAHDDA